MADGFPGQRTHQGSRASRGLFDRKEKLRELSEEEKRFNGLVSALSKQDSGKVLSEEDTKILAMIPRSEKETAYRKFAQKPTNLSPITDVFKRYQGSRTETPRTPSHTEAWTPAEERQRFETAVRRLDDSRGRPSPEELERGKEVMRFVEQTHSDIDRSLARIEAELQNVEAGLRHRPDSRKLEQLQLLRLTKDLIQNSRDAQKELSQETRFLYEGAFTTFIDTRIRDKKYERRAGGLELIRDAIESARAEVKRRQEAEPDKSRRSKLVPKPIEEMDLKTWQNRLSQILRFGTGYSSTAIDTGLVVGLVLSNAMARTGDIISYTDPAYSVGMLVGLATVGKTVDDIKRTALTEDVLTSAEYLSDREKKGRKKRIMPMSGKQVRALLGAVGYSLMQGEAVLVAVAGAQQGGESYREAVAARDAVNAQIERLRLPSNFASETFDDEGASAEAYAELNETTRFFVDVRRKFSSIIAAEAGGDRIEGAGGTGSVGRGRNWGGKYAILRGITETDEDILLSAPAGLREGMQARGRIQDEFRRRFAETELGPREDERLSARARNYREIAESIVHQHFDPGSTVLLEGVSVETQVGAFYNDLIQALDAPAFIDPNDSNRRISLRELHLLYETGILETGAEIALWSDDPTDAYRAKLSQSIGITPPNRSTLRPHILKIQDVVPLYAYLQNMLFTERTKLLMELVQEELRQFDGPNASSDSSISLNVPELSIDITPYTEDINTNPSSTWFSWETHHDAFKTWERAGMSLSVLALIFLINFSGPLLTRLRIEKTEQARREEFKERRKQFEGEHDRTEGAEYLLAEHISQGLNRLVQSPALNGIFPQARFTTDMVQAAMREAAANDQVPVMANSPFASPTSPVGKLFHGLSRYPHGLKHMVYPAGLPEPPAVKAYNHLVTLYNDSVGLTVRIAEQLLPGFGTMMETLLKDPEFVKRALLPAEEFKVSIQNATAEEQGKFAAKRAKLLAAIHDVAAGHHAFAKRYAQTKIEHLTEHAFDELYNELAEASEENRGKYLDLTRNPINLLEDNIDAFDANNPGMLETMRESGLRQTIASELEKELAQASQLIATANAEEKRLLDAEISDIGLFGGGAAQILRTAQEERKTRLSAEGERFRESSDPHVRQFSSTTAIRDQVFQDAKRNVLAAWYRSADQQARTKNWVGIPVREQLKAIQAAVKTEGIYFLEKLPLGRKDIIDAFGLGGPLEGISVNVQIESRKKGTRRGTVASDADSEENVPQIQVDRHVVTFEFKDREGAQIFKLPVEIRGTLSKVMDKEKIQEKITGWLEKRKEYFSTRTLLDSVDEIAHDARDRNEKEIGGIQQELARLGFPANLGTGQATNDFVPVVLSKRGSGEAVRILMTDLLPRLARRQVLGDILGKQSGHERAVERILTPRYIANQYGEDGDLFRLTKQRLGMVTKLYASLRTELRETGEGGAKDVPGTLESRVQENLIKDVEAMVDLVERARKDLNALNLSISFIPRSPEFVTVIQRQGIIGRLAGRTDKAERIRIEELLAFMREENPTTRQFAEFLRDGASSLRRDNRAEERLAA